MEVYKTIKRSVSATANGIIGSSKFSNSQSNNATNSTTTTHTWIHPPDTLINGRVEYAVKMLGQIEVQEPKGTHIVRDAIHAIRFHLQVKRGETGHSGAKLRKVILQISCYGVNVMDLRTRAILIKHPLNRISFCADDKQDKRVFSYIAKNDVGKHQCFVFLSDKMAENITLTIGEAFDLAYEKFIKKKGKDLENQKQMLLLRKKIAELEEKNKVLETKLARCQCDGNKGGGNSDLLISLSSMPSSPPTAIPTNGTTATAAGVDKSSPPPLPLAPPPPRRSSNAAQNNTNSILAEIFERNNDSFSRTTTQQPMNLSDLFDDNFDPRADEKKAANTDDVKDGGEPQQQPRNTVAEFEALLRRVDIQLAEMDGWKLERGDTGDTGRDWPMDGDETKEEEQQPPPQPTTPSTSKT